jgi:hypothetical protein
VHTPSVQHTVGRRSRIGCPSVERQGCSSDRSLHIQDTLIRRTSARSLGNVRLNKAVGKAEGDWIETYSLAGGGSEANHPVPVSRLIMRGVVPPLPPTSSWRRVQGRVYCTVREVRSYRFGRTVCLCRLWQKAEAVLALSRR